MMDDYGVKIQLGKDVDERVDPPAKTADTPASSNEYMSRLMQFWGRRYDCAQEEADTP